MQRLNISTITYLFDFLEIQFGEIMKPVRQLYDEVKLKHKPESKVKRFHKFTNQYLKHNYLRDKKACFFFLNEKTDFTILG